MKLEFIEELLGCDGGRKRRVNGVCVVFSLEDRESVVFRIGMGMLIGIILFIVEFFKFSIVTSV